VAPEANTGFELMASRYGEPSARRHRLSGLRQAGKSGLLGAGAHGAQPRRTDALVRFGAWELWVIRHLVEPFERIAQQRLPEAGSAHRMLLEQPAHGLQYNLDGYFFKGELRPLGIVHSEMYPGTQCFRRFVYPCGCPMPRGPRRSGWRGISSPPSASTMACSTWSSFTTPTATRLTVIEFNPRMASQFSDLYLRVDGVDLHRVALELAHGRDPAPAAACQPNGGASPPASSIAASTWRRGRPCLRGSGKGTGATVSRRHAVLLSQERGADRARFQVAVQLPLHGILHLGGTTHADLAARCEEASALLGWPSPCTGGGQPRNRPQPLASTFTGDHPMKPLRPCSPCCWHCWPLAASLLGGCGAMTAQNPSGKYTSGERRRRGR
jgi:hypothetical protein